MHKPRYSSLAIWLAVVLVAFVNPGRPVMAQDGPTTPVPPDVTIHIVQEGDTLASIAALYGTTVQAIQQANGITDPLDIVVGQRLIIPGADSMAATPQATITVGLGDSLSMLAAGYGVALERLASANRIVNPARLYAGQTITVPSVDSPGRPEITSLARLGDADSLWSIALEANSNLVALSQLNQIADSLVVAPGSVIAIAGAPSSMAALPVPWKTLVLHPLPLEQGRSGGLQITTSTSGAISATFLDHNLQFLSDGTTYQAVFGVDRWTVPGLYPLTITLQDQTGTTWTYSRDIQVANGEYEREEIRVSEETASLLLDPETVQGEIAYLTQKMSGFTPEQYWNGLFRLPVEGVLTSPFGTVRTYNGSSTITFHTGADLAAKTGTPIYAPADGVVVDTGLLDIRGYITLIDHGAGVYTGYWHQASILVNPGDRVVAGQQIGTVGSTGLSTASHLHWEMWVGGIQVDPMQWVREVFP